MGDQGDRPDRPTDPTGDRPPADQRPTTPDQAGGPGTPVADPSPLTIEEAAAALGITANAVRQRLKRGTLAGDRTPTGWVVWLPADQATAGTSEPVVGDRPTDQPPTAGRPTTDRPRPTIPTSAPPVDLTPLADLIERQGEEIRRLTEAAATWQFRAMHAEQRLKELGAGDADAVATPYDAPSAQPQPPGAAEAGGAGSEPFAPSVAAWRERTTRAVDVDAAAPRVPWWKFWGRRP